MSAEQPPPGEEHLIHVEDEEVVIEHHPEDWIAFVIFWSLAFIVFLQFFTRYVLNDSLSWTEEIARYGLMWIVFIGGIMVTRRNTHIAVELLSNVMKPGRRAPRCSRWSISSSSASSACSPISRSRSPSACTMQRMTVFDLPMSYVYGGVAFGCIFMFVRQAINVWRNARFGWSRPDDITHQVSATESRTTDARHGFHLHRGAAGRRAGVHRARRLVVHLHAFHRRLSGLRDPAPHGGRHRLVPAARGAVLHPGRQPDELGRHHQPHLRFRGRARGLDARRARARQHHRLGDLRRHVGHRDRGRGRSRHHRDQGDEGSRLRHRIRRRRHRRVLDARADHPAVAAVRDLRHDGERLDRRAVSRRRRARRRDDASS